MLRVLNKFSNMYVACICNMHVDMQAAYKNENFLDRMGVPLLFCSRFYTIIEDY